MNLRMFHDLKKNERAWYFLTEAEREMLLAVNPGELIVLNYNGNWESLAGHISVQMSSVVRIGRMVAPITEQAWQPMETCPIDEQVMLKRGPEDVVFGYYSGSTDYEGWYPAPEVCYE